MKFLNMINIRLILDKMYHDEYILRKISGYIYLYYVHAKLQIIGSDICKNFCLFKFVISNLKGSKQKIGI